MFVVICLSTPQDSDIRFHKLQSHFPIFLSIICLIISIMYFANIYSIVVIMPLILNDFYLAFSIANFL